MANYLSSATSHGVSAAAGHLSVTPGDSGAAGGGEKESGVGEAAESVTSQVSEATEKIRQKCEAGEDTVCVFLAETLGNTDVAVVLSTVLDYAYKVGIVLIVGYLILRIARRIITRVTEKIATGQTASSRSRRASAEQDTAIDPYRGERRAQRARAVGQLLRNLATVFIISMMVFVLLLIFVEDKYITPLFASASVFGVALGFGTQSLVRDFISGIFMILEDQYGVGDIIDVGDAVGTVEVVGLRVTRLRDLEGTVWYIRNGEIMRVGNQSQGWARAVLDIGVAYGTDLDKAIEVLSRVAKETWRSQGWDELILAEPEVWGVQELGDHAIVLRLVVKTAPLEQWKVAREIRRRVKWSFEEEGIDIPFPQQTVWLQGGRENDSDHNAAGDSPQPSWTQQLRRSHSSAPPARGESQAMTESIETVKKAEALLNSEDSARSDDKKRTKEIEHNDE